MRLTIQHETVYEYPRPAMNSVNEAWMRPLTDERQTCLSFRIDTRPLSSPRPYTDYFGNTVYHFDIQEQHSRLVVATSAEVLTEPLDAAAALASDLSEYQPLSPTDEHWLDFLASTPLTQPGSLICALAKEVSNGSTTVSALLQALSEAIRQRLSYLPESTKVDSPAETALEQGAGVCQDFTHVYIATARALGIPARYVSGYLCSDTAMGVTQASHAWPEALLPSTGWVGIDVTNGCFPDERYVRVATGRDYDDVPPIRGAFIGAAPADPTVAVSALTIEAQQQQQ
jgi:transglutaminase-like putative cysteine protease